MSRFYPVKVANIVRETPESVSFSVIPSPEHADKFHFIPGQYLTFRKQMNGEEIRRTYSICTSPEDGELRVGVKAIPDGVFSNFVNNELKEGDELEAMPPMGHFTTEIKPGTGKHYVAMVAGSGITPVLSLIKSILAGDPWAHFSLFYGNRATPHIMFREILEGLKNKYTTRFALYHVLSRESTDSEIFNGRIDADKCEVWLKTIVPPASVDEWFLCGPGDMIIAVREKLQKHGVPSNSIHTELFTAPGSNMGAHSSEKKASSIAEVESRITVVIDGLSTHFTLDSRGDSILDAALHAGADVPYACKGAVCCTCKAKLEQGKVEMDLNYALSQEEVENGYILTCQAHPISEYVVVNYDVG